MKLLVFSDSHGIVSGMIRAVELERPDYIFHLGDVMRDADALAMACPDVPLVGVPGNCDGWVNVPADRVVELWGKRFFLTHGHPYGVKSGYGAAISAARAAGADALFFGHTHRAYCQKEDGLWVMNPGTAGSYGGRTYGVVWVEKGQMGCYTSRMEV